MKKTIAALLALAMLLSLAACGTAEPAPAATEAPAEEPAEEPAAETITFTDSSGREVELPANITKVAPSGPVATMILAAFAPEKLVCVGTGISESQIPYLYDGIADLPVTGQLYGGKATLNLEELLATGAEVPISDNWMTANYPDTVFVTLGENPVLPDSIDTVLEVTLKA